ncbi:hypothetical protein CG709_08830 [Lachnotalea glycerini]|nr:hypothetical protein CG709_08830 [Lachnotalea glycerini]
MDNIIISIQNGNILLIGVLQIVILSNQYVKNGYIKNLSGVLSKHNTIYLAHLVCSILFYTISIIFIIISVFIADFILYDNARLGANSHTIWYILCQILLLSVYSMGVSCVTIAVNNTIAGLLFGFLYYMFIDSFIIYKLVEIFKLPFDFILYGIVNAITGLNMGQDVSQYTMAVVSSAVYFAIIFIFARIFIYKKQII